MQSLPSGFICACSCCFRRLRSSSPSPVAQLYRTKEPVRELPISRHSAYCNATSFHCQRTSSAGVSDGTVLRCFFFFVSFFFGWTLWSGNLSSVSDESRAMDSGCRCSSAVVVSAVITSIGASCSTGPRSEVVRGVLDVFASSWSTVPLICGESRCADARLVQRGAHDQSVTHLSVCIGPVVVVHPETFLVKRLWLSAAFAPPVYSRPPGQYPR